MKPTITNVLPKVKAYYQKNPAGGNLHLVLDDGNIEDTHVQTCLLSAERADDQDGVIIANLLLQMSRTQRKKLHKMV